MVSYIINNYEYKLKNLVLYFLRVLKIKYVLIKCIFTFIVVKNITNF